MDYINLNKLTSIIPLHIYYNLFFIGDKTNPNIIESNRIKNSLKRISKDISEIATELNLDQADKITHYWVRHTYATTLKRSGISIAVISEALGHSSEATTKTYLDKFEQTEIDNTFRHLI